MATEKQVGIAAKLYEARKAAKSFCTPAEYKAKIEHVQGVMRQAMEQTGDNEIIVMLEFLRRKQDNAVSMMWIMAAYVEMVEPS